MELDELLDSEVGVAILLVLLESNELELDEYSKLLAVEISDSLLLEDSLKLVKLLELLESSELELVEELVSDADENVEREFEEIELNDSQFPLDV